VIRQAVLSSLEQCRNPLLPRGIHPPKSSPLRDRSEATGEQKRASLIGPPDTQRILLFHMQILLTQLVTPRPTWPIS